MDQINNPFKNKELAVTKPQQNSAMVSVSAEREVAEVKAAMILARQFPRDPVKAMDDILISCQRQGLAEVAIYNYSRGGSEITGPSIRLSEAIAQGWGNIQFGIREIEQRNGESTVEAYAWELEKNIRQSKIFQVQHVRATKKGTYSLSDPRDLYELVANQGARRMRACILSVIPGDVVEAAVAQCEQTLKSSADTSPEAIKKMVEAFSQFGVTKEQIEKRIQRRVDSITSAHIISLRKIFTSLKDEMSSPQDWFDPIETETSQTKPVNGAEAAKAAILGKRKKAEPASEPAPPPVEDPVPAPETILCPSGKTVETAFCNSTCHDRTGCPSW